MSKLVGIRLPDNLWQEIEKRAKKLNVTRSEVMKQVLIKDLIK